METILKCSVCFEIFENPRVLPCQHTFCSHCLVGIARAREGVIVCPQCRESYPVHSRQGVKSFPANLFINNVLEFINDGSLLRKENNCSSCAGVNVASCRCLFCGEFLCKDCGPKHGERMEEDEGGESCGKGKHQIAELSFLANASSFKPKGYPLCPKHRDEILKYHCQDCQRAICRDCSVFEHREHKVILLKDAIKELKGTIGVMLKESRDKIPQIKKSFEDTGRLGEKLKLQYANTCATIKETKQRHLDELKKILDSREQELLHELRGCFESKKAKLFERHKHLELTLGMITSACEFAENKLRTLEQGDYISSKKEILDSLKGIEADRITEQEDPSDRFLWDYSDNNLGPVTKKEVQKAMGCLVTRHSGFQSTSEPLAHAEAASGGLNESFGSSVSYENTNSSESSEEDTSDLNESTASFGNNTSSPEALHHPTLAADVNELYNLFIQHYSGPSGDYPTMHCNRCGRNNHTDSDCYATYHIRGYRIPTEEITCHQCGQDGHLPKDCWNHSTSLESDDDTQGCTRCGRTNHVLSECYARYTVAGIRLSQNENCETRCSRCGRRNHYEWNCHARYSSDGRRL